MPCKFVLSLIFTLNTLLPSDLLAHDFWIIPNQFQLEKYQKEETYFEIFVGETFRGDRLKRYRQHLKTFKFRSVAAPDKATNILGNFGSAPIGWAALSPDNSYVISYTSLTSTVELGAEKFNSYLTHEGLTHLAKGDPTSKKPINEQFSRCAKTLINAYSTTKLTDIELGLTIELTLLNRSPKQKPTSHSWSIKYLNSPLINTQVQLVSQKSKKAISTARSNKEGKVTFAIAEPGIYMVKAVHIIPKATDGLDWESFWASETFEVLK